jgi:hypothetical protein
MIKIIALACPLIGVQEYDRLRVFNVKNVVSVEAAKSLNGCYSETKKFCVHETNYLRINVVGEETHNFSTSSESAKELSQDFQKHMVKCLK